MADTPNVPSPAPAQPGAPLSNAADYPLDYTHVSDAYANFCRVSRTPEELVLDFGLNPEYSTHPTTPIKITHRLILNFYTAKRLLLALNHFIREHEATFGNLEIDVNKRARPAGAPVPPR